MNFVKNAWITPSHTTDDMLTLSLESQEVHPDHNRLQFDSAVFPTDPAVNQRHTTAIRYMTRDDLQLLYGVIGDYLYGD